MRIQNPKLVITLVVNAALLLLIGGTFWWQDWQYVRPTPKPVSLHQPEPGSALSFRPEFAAVSNRLGGRILFVHFFNPGCPCSRFNVDHVRALLQNFQDRVSFVAVLQGDDAEAAKKQFAKLNLGIPAIPDVKGAVADSLGIYSTPQAVIIGPGRKLLYRGNYNSSRYCTDRNTEFARIALEAALTERPVPTFGPAASVAYGCPLPQNRRKQAVQIAQEQSRQGG